MAQPGGFPLFGLPKHRTEKQTKGEEGKPETLGGGGGVKNRKKEKTHWGGGTSRKDTPRLSHGQLYRGLSLGMDTGVGNRLQCEAFEA